MLTGNQNKGFFFEGDITLSGMDLAIKKVQLYGKVNSETNLNQLKRPSFLDQLKTVLNCNYSRSRSYLHEQDEREWIVLHGMCANQN